MKKVLALVLAVVMVCTMAFAVGVTAIVGGGTSVTPSGSYAQIAPGSTVYFTVADLISAGVKAYHDATTKEFVPEKNIVKVSYGKGAELVASAGWVQIDPDKTKDTSWQYQVALKDSDTAICDETTLDFSIVGVSYKPYGEPEVKYTVDATTPALKLTKFERDYGWKTASYALDPSGAMELTYTTSAGAPAYGFKGLLPLDKIVTLTATYNSKGETVASNVWFINAGKAYSTADNTQIEFAVKAGQKLLRKNYDFTPAQQTVLDGKYGITTADILAAAPTAVYPYIVVNDTNLDGTANITHWANNMNVYALAMDGTLSKVAVTVNDGVATAKVPAYSATFVYTGSTPLKNVSATIGSTAPTTPGTTTNPGTGANDVVGVAAALAVVALVSGAAISLKK